MHLKSSTFDYGLAAEWLMAFAVLAALSYDYSFLRHAGYLPNPFLYDVFDTFMDWFNTADFAVNPGAYDIWQSIYPPISFVFLKIFSIHSCYVGGPIVARDCDWLGRSTLFAVYGLNVLIVAKSYVRLDPKTAVPRTIATSLGLPLLFTLDRGNLIMVCFTFLALGTGPLLKSARLRQLSLAIAINFKPYLLAMIAGPALSRRWRALEGVILAVIGIYAFSYAVFGAGDPLVIIHNTLAWQDFRAESVFGPFFYGSTYSSTLNALHSNLPLMQYLGSRPLESAEIVLTALMRIGQALVLLSFVLAAMRSYPGWSRLLSTIGISLALSTVEVGGYAESFIVYLVFLERRVDLARTLAVFLAYFLSIPFDQIQVHIAHEIHTAYITNRTVGYDFGLTVGMFLRPALVIAIQVSLSAMIIGRAFRAWGATPLRALEAPEAPA